MLTENCRTCHEPVRFDSVAENYVVQCMRCGAFFCADCKPNHYSWDTCPPSNEEEIRVAERKEQRAATSLAKRQRSLFVATDNLLDIALDHSKCAVSSGLGEELTFGQGHPDLNGYWEIGCIACAREHEAKFPEHGACWPFDVS